MATRFTWNEEKDLANRRKHGLSFATAALVFDDYFVISHQDRDVEGEQRWTTIGRVGAVILTVAHTVIDIEGEEVIRLISARKATPSERKLYEEGEDN